MKFYCRVEILDCISSRQVEPTNNTMIASIKIVYRVETTEY